MAGMDTSNLSVPSHPHDIIKATLARLVRRNALAWLAVPFVWATVAMVFLVFPQADAWMESGWLAHLGALIAFVVLPNLAARGAPWVPEPPAPPPGQLWRRDEASVGWSLTPRWLRLFLGFAISSRPQPPIVFAILCFSGLPAQHADVIFLIAALCSCFYHGLRAYIMRLWEHLVLAAGMAIAGVVLAGMDHPSRSTSLLVVAAVTTVYLLAMCWSDRVETARQSPAADEV